MTYKLYDCENVNMFYPKLSNTTFDHFTFKEMAKLSISTMLGLNDIDNGPRVKTLWIIQALHTPIKFFNNMMKDAIIEFNSCKVDDLRDLSENVISLYFYKCFEVPSTDQLPQNLRVLKYDAVEESHPMMKNPLNLMMMENLSYISVETIYEPIKIVAWGKMNHHTIYDVAAKLIDKGFDEYATI